MTNLELLARNVHSWPDNAFAVIWEEGEPVWLNQEDINNTMFPIFISDWLAERKRIQNKPKWEHAPKWANWLAQDSMKAGGSWAWYEFEPEADSVEWVEVSPNDGRIQVLGSGQVIGDWRQTLEQRPEAKAEEKTKMKYKFKVGDKVETIVAGYGCNSQEIGTISTITELGLYDQCPGYRVDNLKNQGYNDFIGEVSFKLVQNEPEWVEWDRKSSECPVPESHDVEIKLDDGTVYRDTPPADWSWEHHSLGVNIVAYRDWTTFKQQQGQDLQNTINKENLLTKEECDFLLGDYDDGVNRQHPAAAQADYPESITPVIDFEQECLSCTDGLKKQSNEIAMSSLYPDYYKSCVGLTELDVYAVHHLFKVNDPSGCVQHASKKLLLSGVRTGGKSAYKDIKEARDALTRKLQLMEQFQENI